MKKLILKTIEMGDRVIEFGGDESLTLPVSVTALFTQAETHNTALKTAAAGQSSGEHTRRSGSAECKRLAAVVRSAMRDISEIAKVLKPSELPGAAELFRMPSNVAYQKLIAAARGFVIAVDTETHKPLFIAKGLPATFVADLTALIVAFEAAVAVRDGGRNELVASTTGLDAKAKVLLTTVRELRAVLRVHFKGQPDRLESFRTAARIHRGRAEEPATPPPVLPPVGS